MKSSNFNCDTKREDDDEKRLSTSGSIGLFSISQLIDLKAAKKFKYSDDSKNQRHTNKMDIEESEGEDEEEEEEEEEGEEIRHKNQIDLNNTINSSSSNSSSSLQDNETDTSQLRHQQKQPSTTEHFINYSKKLSHKRLRIEDSNETTTLKKNEISSSSSKF
jgi:hypothetical protein